MSTTKKVSKDLINLRLDKAASILFEEFSRTKLKEWILKGNILLNGEIASPKEKVNLDDEIEVNPISEVSTEWSPENIEFGVLHETNDFLIVDKPVNLVIHPGAGISSGTLANGLLYKFPQLEEIPRAGIVHRLDKDTSGLLVVAKNERFRLYFIDLLQSRKVKKNYRALIIGTLRGNLEIDMPIGRDKNNRTKMTCREDGKEAITHVKSIDSYGGYSLLDVEIETGRTHQIRTHLAHKKLPIIGDKTYNTRKIIAKDTPDELKDFIRSFPRQALHAHKIGFKLPDSEDCVIFESKIPKDLKELITTLERFNIS
jgi:23S rRNA pseudouridine1911/1915/1917 synthase